MNKRDVVLGLLDASRTPEYIPAAFFLHFDPAYHCGEAAVLKHLEYFRSTGMDFIKIQYEHPFPRIPAIQTADDWGQMPFYKLDFFEQPLRVVEGLMKAAKKDALVVQTLYSPFMCAGHAAGSEQVLTQHIEENPETVKRGMEAVTESLRGFVRECIRLGVDGFYHSTRGGEAGRFGDPSLFDACVRPYDLTLMKEIDQACDFNILHICDYRLPYASLDPYLDYPGDVVNCSLELTGRTVSAKEVVQKFQRPFMGGMHRKGILATGTHEEIHAAVEAVCRKAPDRFILGADCTVPSGIDWGNLRTAIDTAHGFRNFSF